MSEALMDTDTEDGSDFSDQKSTFGDRIVAAREALGMSAEDLAHKLGIKTETLENWENDRAEPRANKMQMLAGVLNVSIIWLMSGAGETDFSATERGAGLDADFVAELRGIKELQVELMSRLNRLERKLLSTS